MDVRGGDWTFREIPDGVDPQILIESHRSETFDHAGDTRLHATQRIDGGGRPLGGESMSDAFDPTGDEPGQLDHASTGVGVEGLAAGSGEQTFEGLHGFGAGVGHRRLSRIARSTSRLVSRSLMVARLSCICLPRQRPSSTLT